ncbi:MAG: DNA double-strand break repair nuclease NurA [Nanoarchaeota archaeon]|nr:DNA double-strand break repair nuclease NurA [Nanoarchaeota archaeon]
MDKEIITKVINSLNQSIKEQGAYAQFNDPSYEPVKISKDKFHNIKETSSNSKIAFIDGGNSELLKAPNFSLQLIRTYYTVYQNNKRISSKKKEFYILISASNNENNITYKTEFFNSKKDKIEFDSFDETIRPGNHRISISSIGNAIRRFAELEVAKDITNELSQNDIIVLDGDLNESITNEKHYFEELYQKAIEKSITICALSKTSELFTEKGNALIPVLNNIAPIGEWYYFPLVKIKNQAHKSDIYIIKLNKSSNYIFKLEVFNQIKYNIDNILKTLKNNSKDPVFLGYPYGLIEADKFARISNRETEHIKTIFLAKLGKDNQKIAQYLNTLNTHTILDSISF